jgi:hypothetical protein
MFSKFLGVDNYPWVIVTNRELTTECNGVVFPTIACWGIPAPPYADRGCTDSCSTASKAHWHNILRGSAKSPTSTGESILLEIYRERITTYMEEEDHFTQTQLPDLLLHLQLLQWQQGCCHCSSLFLSILTFNSLSQPSQFALNKTCLFIGKYGQHGGASNALKCATNCGMNGATTNLVVGYCH